MAIAQLLSLKSKTNGTLSSQTFKDEEKKVSLLFLFDAQGLMYILLFNIAHCRNEAVKISK